MSWAVHGVTLLGLFVGALNVVFCLWLWRRHGFASGLWFAVYAGLSVAAVWPVALVTRCFVDHLNAGATPLGLAAVAQLTLGSRLTGLLGALAQWCLFLIVASDILRHFRRDGPSAPPGFRWIAQAGACSTILGGAMVLLMSAQATVLLAFWALSRL